MSDNSLVGERFIGMSRGSARPPNTFPGWQYALIAVVLLIGVIYAAPNLYPPDYALQVRADTSEATLDDAIESRVASVLKQAGIQIKGIQRSEKSVLVRVASAEDQLRGQKLLATALNPGDERRYVVALNLAPTTPEWLRDLGAEPMSFGLDLSGGVHFLLQVDMQKALVDRMLSEEENIKGLLREERVRYQPGQEWLDGTQLKIAFSEDAVRDQAQALIAEKYSDFTIQPRDVRGRPGLWLTLSPEKIQEIEDYAIDQNLQSLRKRVNELGVSEPLVQRLGRSRIVVDLPGVQDSADAKRILNKFANLEFRLVAGPKARPSETETYEYEGRKEVLEKRNIVTGDRVTNAVQNFDQESGLPQVSITLDTVGGERMNKITRDNVGNQMAILFTEQKPKTRPILDDRGQPVLDENGKPKLENYMQSSKRLINVATIRSALGFRFRITGIGLGEARDLALLLRAGALAAPMYIVEERTVGASLGEENITKGMESIVTGFLLVLVFMLVYYKMFGLAADIALTANLVLLVAIMSLLHATLTLPGIAGIVLTVGMAVDANVLIFSRIKEELVKASPQQAIQRGFDRAFVTILDANITTFFVAIILLSFGSGPVKGFAVTLAIGIVTSMFTAILVTRALVNLMYGGRKVETLRI